MKKAAGAADRSVDATEIEIGHKIGKWRRHDLHAVRAGTRVSDDVLLHGKEVVFRHPMGDLSADHRAVNDRHTVVDTRPDTRVDDFVNHVIG